MSVEEVRCDCRTQPLLGILRVDDDGLPFFHLKTWKQKKLIAEVEITGPLKIRCRSCLRWHKITPRQPNNSTEQIVQSFG